MAESLLFADLLGQPLAVDLLAAALRCERLAPAYLFAGPDGVGRRLAAQRFLEGVLTGGETSERERRRLESGNHPDLLWVEPTYQHQGRLLTRAEVEEAGVSRRTPPQLRLEQIREVSRFLGRQPVEAQRGMVVIEGAEAMPEATANALLKTLEEPGQGLLILLCAAPERLLSTIRSRCQLIRFLRLEASVMQTVLSRCDAQADDPEELLAMASALGALPAHRERWGGLPPDLIERLGGRPASAVTPRFSAGSDERWMVNSSSGCWIGGNTSSGECGDDRPLRRLETLRRHLLGFVQPRLAWEVALLELVG